jgi:hypothetical protein
MFKKGFFAKDICPLPNQCPQIAFKSVKAKFVVRKVCEAGPRMLQKPPLSLELKIRRSNGTSGSGRGIICSRYPTIKNIF